jgi:hypothetical protein
MEEKYNGPERRGGGENENGWKEWSKHVLFELKRLNESMASISEDIGELKICLAKHDSFIEEAKRRDILTQISDNTKFREGATKIIWKVVLSVVGSGGAVTALINYVMKSSS